jgi:hypothetical protein
MSARPREFPPILACVVLAGLSLAAPAQGQQPVGGEFHVNTYTSDDQVYSRVSSPGDGSFVVVWRSNDQTGDPVTGIFAQRFDRQAMPVPGELHVNTYTPSFQTAPVVGSAADGGFVVVWASLEQMGDEIFGIFGHRFTSQAAPVGGDFHVNLGVTNNQLYPSMSVAADSSFVVVWRSDDQPGDDLGGIFGRRFTSQAAPIGGEFHVNTYTTGTQESPSVSRAADGSFVVVWQNDDPSGNGRAIVGRRFTSQAAPIGGEFQVNTYTTGNHRTPVVSRARDGSFVVVWESYTQGLLGRSFDSRGTPVADAFQIGPGSFPAVGSTADGGFVVVWQRPSGGSDNEILGRRFDSLGQPQSPEFPVNTYTSNGQLHPAIAMTGNGSFVVTWHSRNQTGDAGAGIFGQRFEFPTPLPTRTPSSSPTPTPRTLGGTPGPGQPLLFLGPLCGAALLAFWPRSRRAGKTKGATAGRLLHRASQPGAGPHDIA